MSSVTDAQHAAAVSSLYPDAAARVDARWARGRLEARAASPLSSQALCVSVVETIAARPAKHRRAVLNAICTDGGLGAPVTSDVHVESEVREHRQVLSETGGGTPTALDGLATWDDGVLTIESKFTEPEFGSCGQIKPLRVKPGDPRYDAAYPDRREANCSGQHARGSDRKPTTSPLGAACRLTVPDGRRAPRRYWDVAPHLFGADVTLVPRPCPFVSDSYQLMRNLAFAHQWPALGAGGWYGFLVCLVGGATYAPVLTNAVETFRALLRPEVRERVGLITYERIADVLNANGEVDLASWVKQRIEGSGLKPPD